MTKHHPAHEVELYRDGATYTVYVELPDIDPDEVSVRWQDGRLHVSAEPAHVYEDPSSVYHRQIGFPKAIDEEGITASLDDGVLQVRLPIVGDHADHGRDIAIT
jgi:HSP20 family protein